MKKLFSLIMTIVVMNTIISGCSDYDSRANNPRAEINTNQATVKFKPYMDKYVDPLVVTGISIFSWDNADKIDFEYLDNYFRYVIPPGKLKQSDTGYGYEIAKKEYDDAIENRFDLSPEHLDLRNIFSSDKIYFSYPENDYKYVDKAYTRINQVDEDKNKIIIHFEYYDPETGLAYKNVTLRITNKGDSFKYSSCDVIDSLQNLKDLTPWYKQAFLLKYIKPIAVDSSIAYGDWKDANTILASRFETFFANSSRTLPECNVKQYAVVDGMKYKIPRDILENYVCKYFDVSREHLRESDFYDSTVKVYTGFYSDSGMDSRQQIERISMDGNNLIIVFSSSNWESGIMVSRTTYEVNIRCDGENYKYIYCKKL